MDGTRVNPTMCDVHLLHGHRRELHEKIAVTAIAAEAQKWTRNRHSGAPGPVQLRALKHGV